MNPLASLALSTEPPDDKILERPPNKRDEYILSSKMIKHILGQALYQYIIVMFVVFTGDLWIPEYGLDELDDKGRSVRYNTPNGTYSLFTNASSYLLPDTVRSGRMKIPLTNEPDYKLHMADYGPTRHYTFLFTTFVFMQIFNFFNSRHIRDEFNIFASLLKHPLYLYPSLSPEFLMF